MNLICGHCGKTTEIQSRYPSPPEKIAPQLRKFFNNRQPAEAMMVPYDSSFFEIVSGQWKGNLVHIFDLIK